MFGFALRKLSHFCVRNYYGRMQIDGTEQIPQTGPVLLCANHPNSLLDPVLVGYVARRPVRFLAKAPLFSMPVVGSIMRALGMIPAFRGRDSAREVGRNTASLDQATNILLQQGAVGIFPEGLSHDRVGVEMVRSGAARMALSANEQGLKELTIAPIGLNYEDKERFRSEIWIQISDPINLDAWLQNREGKPKQIQRQLTDEIDLRLKNCVIHLNDENWEPWFPTVEMMLEGTSINTGVPTKSKTARLARRKAIANRMNQFLADNEEQGIQLGQQINELETKLNDSGLELFEFSKLMNGGNETTRFAGNTIWFLLLFPVAVLGTLHHIVPFTIVRTLSKRVQSKVNRTDVSLYRLLFSIPLYLLTYAGIGYLLARGTNWTTAIAWLSLAPFAGIIALEYWPALGKFVKRWRQHKQLSNQGAKLQQAEEEYLRLSKEIQQISTLMESNSA